MTLPVIRWFFSLPSGMFYCLVASGLHEALGSSSGIPAFAPTLAMFLFHSSMGLWVLSDARRHRRDLPYDFGSFVFFTWPLLVPIHLFSTRGWRAFVTLGLFLLLYVAAELIASIPVIISSVHH